MQYLAILDKAIGLIVGLLNILGASQTVSNLIAKRIAEGRDEWSPEDLATVTAELDKSEQRADAAIAAAGGPAAPPPPADPPPADPPADPV